MILRKTAPVKAPLPLPLKFWRAAEQLSQYPSLAPPQPQLPGPGELEPPGAVAPPLLRPRRPYLTQYISNLQLNTGRSPKGVVPGRPERIRQPMLAYAPRRLTGLRQMDTVRSEASAATIFVSKED